MSVLNQNWICLASLQHKRLSAKVNGLYHPLSNITDTGPIEFNVAEKNIWI